MTPIKTLMKEYVDGDWVEYDFFLTILQTEGKYSCKDIEYTYNL